MKGDTNVTGINKPAAQSNISNWCTSWTVTGLGQNPHQEMTL